MNSRMHQASAVALAILLTGCASSPATPPPHVITVQLPCEAASPANRPPKPPLRLLGLNPNNPGAVAKAFALSLTEHRAREEALETLLDACK